MPKLVLFYFVCPVFGLEIKNSGCIRLRIIIVMNNGDDSNRHREFNIRLCGLYKQKDSSSTHLPESKYKSIIHRLHQLSSGCKKIVKDYRLMKVYQLIRVRRGIGP